MKLGMITSTWRGGSQRAIPELWTCFRNKRFSNFQKIWNPTFFKEKVVHKPDFDETWYDHIYVTMRITACYSRYNDIVWKYKFPNKSPLTPKSSPPKKKDGPDKKHASDKKNILTIVLYRKYYIEIIIVLKCLEYWKYYLRKLSYWAY